MILSLNLRSSWLNEFFHKTWPPEKLLNHKEVHYFYMPNLHDVIKTTLGEYVRRRCREDRNDAKNQCYNYNQWVFFKLYLMLFLIKLYFEIIFWIAFAVKFERKCLLEWKHFSYVKDWKTNKLFFRCIILSWNCLWNHLEPGYLQKKSNWIQNNFFTWKYNLHKNFCYGIHQEIRTLRFHSDHNLFFNRPYTLMDFPLMILIMLLYNLMIVISPINLIGLRICSNKQIGVVNWIWSLKACRIG